VLLKSDFYVTLCLSRCGGLGVGKVAPVKPNCDKWVWFCGRLLWVFRLWLLLGISSLLSEASAGLSLDWSVAAVGISLPRNLYRHALLPFVDSWASSWTSIASSTVELGNCLDFTLGLTNLVWLWNTQDMSSNYWEYNPGPNYFDSASLDIYGNG